MQGFDGQQTTPLWAAPTVGTSRVQKARSGRAGRRYCSNYRLWQECCVGSFAQEPGGRWCLGHDLGWLGCWLVLGRAWLVTLRACGCGNHNRDGGPKGPVGSTVLPCQPCPAQTELGLCAVVQAETTVFIEVLYGLALPSLKVALLQSS